MSRRVTPQASQAQPPGAPGGDITAMPKVFLTPPLRLSPGYRTQLPITRAWSCHAKPTTRTPQNDLKRRRRWTQNRSPKHKNLNPTHQNPFPKHETAIPKSSTYPNPKQEQRASTHRNPCLSHPTPGPKPEPNFKRTNPSSKQQRVIAQICIQP